MNQRKKLKLNVSFKNGEVICAKPPNQCKECKEECEKMDLYYYPFNDRDVKECFKDSERKR